MYELEIKKIHYFSTDEGWWIACDYSANEYCIAMWDDSPFKSNDEALTHCINMAKAGSKLHQLACEIHGEQID